MKAGRLLCVGLALTGWFCAVHGTESVPVWDDLRHTIVAGDTLEALALRYTGRRVNWMALQQANQVAPRRLQPGRVLLVPAALRLPAAALARVAYAIGPAEARTGAGAPVALAAGMALAEGSEIVVGRNGYVRLAFPDGSSTALPENTRVVIERLRHQPLTSLQQADIRLESGRADSEVAPRRRAASRFRIHTPLAVASVRGTRFGMEVRPDASISSDVLQGQVEITASHAADAGRRQPAAALLSPGQGTRLAADGEPASTRALPPAPDLSPLPATLTDADVVALALPAAAASSYRVRIARDAGMSTVVGNAVTAAGAGTALLPALPDGDYVIGARAINELGLHSAESTRAVRIKAHPLPPLFQSPEPRERVRGAEVTLRCAAPAGAARIRLQIAATPSFDAPLLDLPDMPGCLHTAALQPGRYYWRTAAVEQQPGLPADEGPFSRPQAFEVEALPQAPGTLAMAPSEGGLRVHWAAVPGLRYRVQIATDPSFAAPLPYDLAVAEGEVRIDCLPPGHYVLRMQATGPDGVAGPFSAPWRVRIGRHWHTADGRPLTSELGDPVMQAP